MTAAYPIPHFGTTNESEQTSLVNPPRPSPLTPLTSSLTTTDDSLSLSDSDIINSNAIPSGLDAASYIAGERAAYSRAFAAALPSQHALGQLFKAVDTLHARIEEDAAVVRAVHTENIRSSSELSSVSQRIFHIEQSHLPSLQQRIDAVADRPAISPEINEALRHLRDVLGALSQAQHRYLEAATTGYCGSISVTLMRQLYALCAAAVAFSGSILSKADIAALFLSRKILLAPLTISSLHVHSNNADQHRNTRMLHQPLQDTLQSIIAASLFVGTIEAAWRLHESASRPLPKAMRRLGSPLRVGLRIVRAGVWSSAFVVAVHEMRHVCGGLAHSVVEMCTPYVNRIATDDGKATNNVATPKSTGVMNKPSRAMDDDDSPFPPGVSCVVENELFDTP